MEQPDDEAKMFLRSIVLTVLSHIDDMFQMSLEDTFDWNSLSIPQDADGLVAHFEALDAVLSAAIALQVVVQDRIRKLLPAPPPRSGLKERHSFRGSPRIKSARRDAARMRHTP